MHRRLFFLLTCLLGAAHATPSAPASEPPAPEPAPAQKETPPQRPLNPAQRLQLAVESLRAFVDRDPRPAAPAVARFLDREIAPLFDFEEMARAAAGRLHARLTPDQRKAMAEEIKRLFLTRLTQALALYEGQQVRFSPARFSPDRQRAVIPMAILGPGRYPARIDFRLARLPGKGWRIVDLAANGHSAVIHYRRMLAHEMARRARLRPPPVPPGAPVR